MRRRLRLTPLALIAVAALLAACGTNSSEGASSGSATRETTLAAALKETLNPDPDQFFDLEGAMVTNSVYESLVVNPPGSTETEGLLAESWEISPDGLTYTFTLKPDISFSDGTPIDSSVMQSSFERRTESAGAPSYMLAEVASYETPDPRTFVINLSQPVNNFLARLASPWAPMATNPNVIAEAEAEGDPLGAEFLKTNSAGSGPYVISRLLPDQEVVLTRSENYWGDEPYFEQVVFKILPDPSAQRLQLESGELDMIQGVSPETADSLAENPDLTVSQPEAFNMTFWQTNSVRAPFNAEIQAALPKAIPYEEIVEDVFGEYATVADQTITANRIPDDMAEWDPEYDPAALKAAFENLPADQQSIEIETAFPANDNGVHRRLNDYMVEILTEAGFTVTSREFTLSEYFGFIGVPEEAPHMVVSTQPDDGVHPDNWYRIWMHTAGALNVGAAGTAESDALFDEANAMPPGDEPPYELYAEGGKIVTDAGQFIPVADAPVIWVTNADLEGVTVRYASDQALVIPLLSRGS